MYRYILLFRDMRGYNCKVGVHLSIYLCCQYWPITTTVYVDLYNTALRYSRWIIQSAHNRSHLPCVSLH